ncbi:MAG: hypothetical protein ABI862_00580 [Ilumatobacteraceae bacterium]
MSRPGRTVGNNSTATRLSTAFARSLTDAYPQFGVRRRYIGIEHEYVVHAAGKRVDFRELIRSLDIDGEAIDPADALARRCRWGGVVTADGPEAEIATPPVALGRGFSALADGLARVGRSELERSAGSHSFEGYSTHISISMNDDVVQAAAKVYAERFAAALMLLLDSPSSPGLLVRPRPGRLELCGEHADGERLRAASLFAAGSALAAERAVTDRAFRRRLPPRLRVKTVPSLQRYGLYVDRAAFGCDLYRHGRSSTLRSRRGGRLTADEHLRQSWRCARSMLAGFVDETELHSVDALVSATTPLPTDQPSTAPLADQIVDDSAFGRALDRRERREFSVACTWLAWHVAVFTISSNDRSAFAVIPTSLLEQFLGQLDAGTLDGVLGAYLATSSTGRVVASTDAAGLYDDLADASALNLDELGRDGEPVRGRGSGANTPNQRPGKEQEAEGPPSVRRRLLRPRLLVGAAIAVVLAVLIAVIAASAGGGSAKKTAATDPSLVLLAPVVTSVAPSTTASASTSISSSTTSSSTSTVPATSSTLPVVVRTGPTSGGATATQDGGEFAMAITMEVLTPSVRPGTEVAVHWVGTLDGPNWIQNFSTGEWSVSCVDGSNTRRTGTLRAFLIPIGVVSDPSTLYSIRANVSAVDAADPARAQYPGLIAASTDGVITNSVTRSGCDLNDTYEATAPLQIPADTPPGEYYVVSVNYPKRDWGPCAAACPGSYADIAGVVPTVMVEPSV